MMRAPRTNPLSGWTGPPGSLTEATHGARQDAAHFPASDAAVAPPDLRDGGGELHDRRMSPTAGSPRGVSRTERWRPEQAEDKRQRQEALAGEIHDF